jgi:SAM-dependent methyltransferase
MGRFYAVDFHPAHIAEALNTAKGARLDNVTFFEQSFDEFLHETLPDLPAFDFITIHGVYSWVCPDDRQRIVEIIQRRLKTGGIVYISYNSLPGWCSGEPIQRLLFECGMLFSDRSDRRFERALSLLEDFRNEKSPILSDDQLFDRITDIKRRGRLRYLTHEYMNENWQPLYHADVARHLKAAKLTFVGSANALDNFPDLNFTKSRQELLSKIGNPEVRETLKDYFVPRLLRKDVYVRGPLRLNKFHQAEILDQLGLALIVPRQHAKLSMRVPVGEVSVSENVFTPVLDALAERPHTMNELLTASGPHEKPSEKAAEIAGILIGTWQAAPVKQEGTGPGQNAVDRFNFAMSESATMEDISENFPLASSVLGSAVQASGLEIFVYQAAKQSETLRTEELVARLWKHLVDRGERLEKNGTPLNEETESRTFLKDTIETIVKHKLPVWRNLGIL